MEDGLFFFFFLFFFSHLVPISILATTTSFYFFFLQNICTNRFSYGMNFENLQNDLVVAMAAAPLGGSGVESRVSFFVGPDGGLRHFLSRSSPPRLQGPLPHSCNRREKSPRELAIQIMHLGDCGKSMHLCVYECVCVCNCA